MIKEKIIKGLVIILAAALILLIANRPEDNSDNFKREIAEREAQISNLRTLYDNSKAEYQKDKKVLKNRQDSLKDVVFYYREELNKIPEYYKGISDEKQVEVLGNNLDTSLYVDNNDIIQLPMNRASWINTEYERNKTFEKITCSQQEVITTQDSIIKMDSSFIALQSSHIDSLSVIAQKAVALSKKINKGWEEERKKSNRWKRVATVAGTVIFVETIVLILQ